SRPRRRRSRRACSRSTARRRRGRCAGGRPCGSARAAGRPPPRRWPRGGGSGRRGRLARYGRGPQCSLRPSVLLAVAPDGPQEDGQAAAFAGLLLVSGGLRTPGLDLGVDVAVVGAVERAGDARLVSEVLLIAGRLAVEVAHRRAKLRPLVL